MALIQKFVKNDESPGLQWTIGAVITPPGDNASGGHLGSWPNDFAILEDGDIVSSYIGNNSLYIHLDTDIDYAPSQTLNNPAEPSRSGVAVDAGNNFIVTHGAAGPAQVWQRVFIDSDSDGAIISAYGPWTFAEMVGGFYYDNNGIFVSRDDQTIILSHEEEDSPIEVFKAKEAVDAEGNFSAAQTITPPRVEPEIPLVTWKFMSAGDYQLILASVYKDPTVNYLIYSYSDPIAFIYSSLPPPSDSMFWWTALIYASQTQGPSPEEYPPPEPDPGPIVLPTPPSLPPWSDLGTPRGSLIGLNITEPGLVPAMADLTSQYRSIMYTNGQGIGGYVICGWNSTGELVSCVFDEDNELYEFQYQVGDIFVPNVWIPGVNNWQDIVTYPEVEVVSVQASQLPITGEFQPYNLALVTNGILEGDAVDGQYYISTLSEEGQLGSGASRQASVTNGVITNIGVDSVQGGLATFDQGYITGEVYLLDIIGNIPGVTGINNQYVQVLGMILDGGEGEGEGEGGGGG